MDTLYLTPEHSVWCLPDAARDVTCLLPSTGATPDETLPADGPGEVGLVFGQVEAPVGGAEALGLRSLFDRTSPALYGIAARAVPMAEWRRTNRHCGVCATALARDPVERAMVCPACGHRVYPRINPVVIVRVTRGDELLLARRAVSPTGFFSVIAGFVEAGESLEETLVREVREEVGIAVRNIRYFHSQPWSFPNNLMVAFTADYAGGEVRPDGVEMSEAGWFRRNALPTLPGPVSIARRMIDAWLAERPPRPRE